jgi:non-specific protein-tyrosine kinase
VDLRDYVRVLRRRWRVVVIAAMVGLGAAALATAATTPTYQAQAKLFVSTQNDNGDVSGVYQGGLLAQQRVKSYVDLVQGKRVAERVVERLKLPLTPQELRGKIDASAPLDTVLLKILVTDPSPGQAQRIADATADAFTEFVTEIEKPEAGGVAPVKVSVVERAEVPTHPVAPRTKLNLALGLLVGLATGFGGAIVREMFDTTLKDGATLADKTGTSLLGVIGVDPDIARRPLVVQVEPQAQLAEAYRHLRTSIQFVAVDQQIGSFVITSAVAGEGKSTVAANLAIAIAQLGQRVVLVETDLRRPTLSTLFGIEGSVGLTDVLIGRASLEDALQTWGGGSLELMPAGTSPPNPSELLASRAMSELIAALEGRAEMVVFDAPPLLPVTDAAILATRTSGAVMIARAGSTKSEQVERAVATLHAVGAPLLGCVLTVAPVKGPDAAYYYAYATGAQPIMVPDAPVPGRARTPVIDLGDAEPPPEPAVERPIEEAAAAWGAGEAAIAYDLAPEPEHVKAAYDVAPEPEHAEGAYDAAPGPHVQLLPQPEDAVDAAAEADVVREDEPEAVPEPEVAQDDDDEDSLDRRAESALALIRSSLDARVASALASIRDEAVETTTWQGAEHRR